MNPTRAGSRRIHPSSLILPPSSAGKAWLKGAFSETAVLSAQKDERIGRLLERLTAGTLATGRPASRSLTGAHGASHSDDTPRSVDHDSATGVLGPNPGILTV